MGYWIRDGETGGVESGLEKVFLLGAEAGDVEPGLDRGGRGREIGSVELGSAEGGAAETVDFEDQLGWGGAAGGRFWGGGVR